MIGHLNTIFAVLIKAISNPKIAILALRERGLTYVLRSLLKSKRDLSRIVSGLENRSTVGYIENTYKGERYIKSMTAFDANHLLVELKSSERFLIRKTHRTSDMAAIKETFLEQTYNDHSDLTNQIVVDIGANVGDTAVYFAKKGARVRAYEPSKELYQLAVRNAQLNNVSVDFYNVGVSDRSGTLYLTHSKAGADINSTLVSRRQKEALKPDHFIAEKIAVVPFAEIVQRCDTVRLLKLDCEGCEFPSLLSLSKSEFAKIQSIIMEFHKPPEPLIKALESNNFVIRKRVNFEPVNDIVFGYIYADRVDGTSGK